MGGTYGTSLARKYTSIKIVLIQYYFLHEYRVHVLAKLEFGHEGVFVSEHGEDLCCALILLFTYPAGALIFAYLARPSRISQGPDWDPRTSQRSRRIQKKNGLVIR